jgi:hypothetical protein
MTGKRRERLIWKRKTGQKEFEEEEESQKGNMIMSISEMLK